jgi:excisionase family DNA binding protein
MAKKYLSIEEAAEWLGMSTDELSRHREKGEIRGFADRGTWKFKGDDVEEFGRSRQADSSPEVPILGADSGADAGSILDDDDDLAEQPTVVRKDLPDELPVSGASDSDVRLVFDEEPNRSEGDTDPDVPLIQVSDSDSDVRLEEATISFDSDSDVKLVESDSDSDVKLEEDALLLDIGSDSDSDVKIVGSDSDSDVQLVAEESDSDVKLLDSGSDSDVQLLPSSDASTVSESEAMQIESDIGRAIEDGTDSGLPELPFMADDSDADIPLTEEAEISFASGSGISLESPADSGVSLEEDETAMTLELDSGITLADDEEDEGITLSDDIGIALETSDDSGIALEVGGGRTDADLDQTIPMLKSDDDDDLSETILEVPTLDDDDSEFELGALEGEEDSDTSVLLFDDEDDDELDGTSETLIKKSNEVDFGGDEFDVDADEFEETADFDGDDFDVADDDIVGEDDELDELDVFDADDDDFEESFETGESHPEFVSPARGRVAAAPIESDWGAATFAALTISSLLMCVCGMIVYDLVRTMWGWQEASGFNGVILDAIGGLFAK